MAVAKLKICFGSLKIGNGSINIRNLDMDYQRPGEFQNVTFTLFGVNNSNKLIHKYLNGRDVDIKIRLKTHLVPLIYQCIKKPDFEIVDIAVADNQIKRGVKIKKIRKILCKAELTYVRLYTSQATQGDI